MIARLTAVAVIIGLIVNSFYIRIRIVTYIAGVQTTCSNSYAAMAGLRPQYGAVKRKIIL